MAAAAVLVCRFCHQADPSLEGIQVCECKDSGGFAHLVCFYRYVRETSRRQCEYCLGEWQVDAKQWKNYIIQKKKVLVWNRVREAASILVTLLTILAMITVWIYLVKAGVWVVYQSPNYMPFGFAPFYSSGWLCITMGEVAVGALGTLSTILLAVLMVQTKPACYRCCCLPRKRSYGRPLADGGDDDDEPNEHALELNELRNRSRTADTIHVLTKNALSVDLESNGSENNNNNTSIVLDSSEEQKKV